MTQQPRKYSLPVVGCVSIIMGVPWAIGIIWIFAQALGWLFR